MSKALEKRNKHRVDKSRDSLSSYVKSCGTKGGRLRDDIIKIHKQYEKRKIR